MGWSPALIQVWPDPPVLLGHLWSWWGMSPHEFWIAASLPLQDQFAMSTCAQLEPPLVADYLIELSGHLGITQVAESLRQFDLAEFAAQLTRVYGYRLDHPTRLGMLDALLEGLTELGVLRTASHQWRWTGKKTPSRLSLALRQRAEQWMGTNVYHELALLAASSFLKGAPAPVLFDESSAGWLDQALDRPLAELTKAVAVKAMELPREAGLRLLELSFGRGHGLVHLLKAFPNAEIEALDFTDACVAGARARIEVAVPSSVKRVTFVPAACWEANGVRGFGAPLPFEDQRFDGVFISLHDAYIAPEVRATVYQDIYRVLRPGGCLSMVQMFRPDPERRIYTRSLDRVVVCYYSAVVSLLEGSFGFVRADEIVSVWRRAGFDVSRLRPKRFGLFHNAVWRMQRPD